MIVNLTQHPATPEQVAAGVADLPAVERAALIDLLTVDELPSPEEIRARCNDIALMAVMNGLGGDDADDPHPQQAMVGGAPWMMAPLVAALREQGVEPIFAFSRRESVESAQADGSVRKINVFRHAGFVPAV